MMPPGAASSSGPVGTDPGGIDREESTGGGASGNCVWALALTNAASKTADTKIGITVDFATLKMLLTPEGSQPLAGG
jgi:hypothetical protein